jgi:phosphonoacetate hydrolase
MYRDTCLPLERGITSPQRVVVAMIDGLDPAYLAGGTMPQLAGFGQVGLTATVEAVLPTVTNANNASICCAAWPSEHGITGNSYFNPVTGQADYMESAAHLTAPTLLERVTAAGGKSALLTAKVKTVGLLGNRATLAIAAERPDAAIAERYGQPPDIYSAEINHWLWQVAVDLLATQPDLGLLYVHTTDFPMHAWRPGDPRSDRHLRRLDELIASAADTAPDAALFATADHGMNDKTLVWDLAQALASRGTPVRFALSAEKDRYVKHHRTFGGTAWVWLSRPGDEAAVTGLLSGLDGVEAVIPRDVAARRFHLYPDRIGDLVVLGDRGTVFGELPPGHESERLPDGYRSHGSLHERQVPLVVYNSEHVHSQPPAANKDLLSPLLHGWLPGP